MPMFLSATHLGCRPRPIRQEGENLALRQQLNVFRRKVRWPAAPKARPRLLALARPLLERMAGHTLIVVKPATVVRWYRQGFKYYLGTVNLSGFLASEDTGKR